MFFECSSKRFEADRCAPSIDILQIFDLTVKLAELIPI